jgi:pimeloyl-ACP methyl ester carboxylesterase
MLLRPAAAGFRTAVRRSLRFVPGLPLARGISLSSGAARGSFLDIRGPSASAVREAPTPIIFASGLLHPASAWDDRTGLPKRLQAAGYTVGLLDLPGYGRASAGWRSTQSLDDLVDDLQRAFSALHTAPLVIAPDTTALLMQKYLESFALAGLVMLSPLPPNPQRFLSTLIRKSKLNGSAPTTVNAEQVAHWLQAAAVSDEAVRKLWLARAAVDTADDDNEHVADLAACMQHVEALAMLHEGDPDGSNTGAPVCGFEAAADWLAKLCIEPVNLEPQPVPMLAVFGEHQGFVPADDCLATIKFHALEELHTEGEGGAPSSFGAFIPAMASRTNGSGAMPPELAAVVAGMTSVCTIEAAGHNLLYSAQPCRSALEELLLQWIERRY